ncbi:MAG: hypothetical protein Q4B82_06775 [Alysiella sp.]|uniref:hypothetical protein n=1 Tax=Alysiella sp. TaxID=1872483 RepID=UPI0026DC1AED|nr:hypothetical protein [Alysiella sp.]MDO4434267.1 hypothetical protein [Alysiella sp.]
MNKYLDKLYEQFSGVRHTRNEAERHKLNEKLAKQAVALKLFIIIMFFYYLLVDKSRGDLFLILMVIYFLSFENNNLNNTPTHLTWAERWQNWKNSIRIANGILLLAVLVINVILFALLPFGEHNWRLPVVTTLIFWLFGAILLNAYYFINILIIRKYLKQEHTQSSAYGA